MAEKSESQLRFKKEPAPEKLDKAKLALGKIEDLRKELIEAQKIRAQVIGFKITFVATATGFIVSSLGKIVEPNLDKEEALDFSGALLLVPAFAAIFFDFLISGYSFSIKRMGFYMKEYLEPIIRNNSDWPKDVPLWEEFMARKRSKQYLATFGNIGMTVLTCILAGCGLWFIGKLSLFIKIIFTAALIISLILGIKTTFAPFKFTKDEG